MKVISVSDRFSSHPEEKVITISRVSSANCPFSYYKSYVEKPKPKPPFETIEIGIGSFFHSYVENIFKIISSENRAIAVSDILDIDELVSDFKLAFIWDSKLIKPYKIIKNNTTIEYYITRLIGFGQNFNKFLKNNLVNHTVFDVEGDLEIETEKYIIRGKYDLTTKAPNGDLILWDWKTGQAPSPRYIKELKIKKLQLGIYAIWMAHKFPENKIRGTVVFLRGELAQLTEVFSESIEQDVLTNLFKWREKINKLEKYIPMKSGLCPWCAWKSTCPAWK